MLFSSKKKLTRLAASKSGLTLIEIILVLVLLGGVMSIIGTRAFKTFGKGQRKTVLLQMGKLGQNLDMYRLDCNRYPTTQQGLKSLVEKPSSAPECPNYDPEGYLETDELPKDPWGKEFVYTAEGSKYEIKSLGADGAEGGSGGDADISSKK